MTCGKRMRHKNQGMGYEENISDMRNKVQDMEKTSGHENLRDIRVET